MLKANKKTLIIASIVTIMPLFIGLLFWNRLPDVMATHFGMDNEANGWSSKVFAVFGLPLFLVAMEWIMAAVTSQDPRRQNISPKLFTLILWIIPVVSIVCGAAIYTYNLGMRTDTSFFAMIFMGIMFIVIGNYMPKTRQNYTIGIKIPWTLADEENWNRTHRLAGYLWVAGGILMLLAALTGFTNIRWFFVILVVMTLVPCVYSFWMHARGRKS